MDPNKRTHLSDQAEPKARFAFVFDIIALISECTHSPDFTV